MAERVTLESLTAPNLGQQTRAVQFPALKEGVKFELKAGVIRLLPKFSGTSKEDPIQHLDEFQEVCTIVKPSDITDEQMMLRVFSFSLMESAKDWYHTLSPSSGTTWVALKKLFLDKYFPAIKRSQLRKQICTIEQFANESLHEYFERFNKLLKSCPYHGFPEHDLILNLHEGLCEDDRRMVNSACGGNILKMTYEEALNVFTTLADDSRQYGGRGTKRGVAIVSDFDKEDYELLKEEVRRLKNATQRHPRYLLGYIRERAL